MKGGPFPSGVRSGCSPADLFEPLPELLVLLVLLVDEVARAAQLLLERVAEVEHAADEDGGAEERSDLRAPLDLAQQLARELAEEDLGVVAPRGGGGLDGGLLDEGGDADAAVGDGDGRQISDGGELHPHVERREAQL